MDIDFKKLAPWNWFKKEQEEQQSTASLPVQRNDLPVAGGPVSPILQLHREIDRLFDDTFRGFGFPALAMRDTTIARGDRICQFCVMRKMDKPELVTVERLDNASRGGFGSTGTR